jgi:hypothetical protein
MMHDQSPCSDDADPGNLSLNIDEEEVPRVHTDYRAIDGGPHIPPEALERHAAELIMLSRLRGGAT